MDNGKPTKKLNREPFLAFPDHWGSRRFTDARRQNPHEFPYVIVRAGGLRHLVRLARVRYTITEKILESLQFHHRPVVELERSGDTGILPGRSESTDGGAIPMEHIGDDFVTRATRPALFTIFDEVPCATWCGRGSVTTSR